MTAAVTGGRDLVSVVFAPGVIDPDDPELLGDLVVAAVNQASARRPRGGPIPIGRSHRRSRPRWPARLMLEGPYNES